MFVSEQNHRTVGRAGRLNASNFLFPGDNDVDNELLVPGPQDTSASHPYHDLTLRVLH